MTLLSPVGVILPAVDDLPWVGRIVCGVASNPTNVSKIAEDFCVHSQTASVLRDYCSQWWLNTPKAHAVGKV